MFLMTKSTKAKWHDMHRHHVKAWRLKSKLTLDQVADLIDYNKGSLSEIENYKKSLLEWHIYALSEVFGVEPSAIFRDPNEQSLDELIQDASPETKQSIFVMAAALVQNGSVG